MLITSAAQSGRTSYNWGAMSNLDALGLGLSRPGRGDQRRVQHVLLLNSLRRIMAFRNRSIDDIVNSPIAKNEMYAYWKLQHQIDRHSDVVELEKQWNPLGQRLRNELVSGPAEDFREPVPCLSICANEHCQASLRKGSAFCHRCGMAQGIADQ
jgi:hypothetical protein